MWSDMVYWGTSDVTDQSEENQVIVNADTTDNFYLREHSDAHNNGSNTGFGPVRSQNFGANVHVIHGVTSSKDPQNRRNLKWNRDSRVWQRGEPCTMYRKKSAWWDDSDTAWPQGFRGSSWPGTVAQRDVARACSPDSKPAGGCWSSHWVQRGFFQPSRFVNKRCIVRNRL